MNCQHPFVKGSCGFAVKRLVLMVMFALLGLFSASAQYCTPTYSHYYVATGTVSQISVLGYGTSSLLDTLPFSAAGSGYVDHTSGFDTLRLIQGGTYPVHLSYFTPTNHIGNQVWVDFNDDGVFDTLTERVSLVFPFAPMVDSFSDTNSAIITIPYGAAPGFHVMRVRNAWYNNALYNHVSSSLDPCNSLDLENTYWCGTTVDYRIQIVALPLCTGAPVPGTIAGPSNICVGHAFALMVGGDSVTGGLTYQWYSRPHGTYMYNAITGATSFTYSVASQTSATEYIRTVTCVGSGVTDTTPVFSVAENPAFTCFCVSGLGGYAFDATIDSVSILGTTLNNYTPSNYNIYTAFPDTGSATCNLMQGVTYTLYLKGNGYYNYNAYAWLDADHSGTFDASEYGVVASSCPAGHVSSVNFTVPATADTGLTGLRIRTIKETLFLSSGGACTPDLSGETEDYIVHIIPAIPCSGTPIAGVASASVSHICPDVPFNLGTVGYTAASGITFQWYAATSGTGVFTAISGATGADYLHVTQPASRDYKVVVTCSSSGLSDTSNTITISGDPFYLCYCSPYTGSTLNTNVPPAPLDSVSVMGTAFNDCTPAIALPYLQYWPIGSPTVLDLQQGTAYTINVNSYGTGDYKSVGWIDYDHSGAFSAAESFVLTSGALPGAASSVSFVVPASADTGLTGMRIRTTSYAYYMGISDACTNEYDGMTKDYVIHISTGSPCTGAPSAGVAYSSATNVCAGQSFSLIDTGYSFSVGVSYQWYSAMSGTTLFNPISGATNPNFTTTQLYSTDYLLSVTCTGSGTTTNSNIISVVQNPFYLCYCGTPTGSHLNDDASIVFIDSVAIAGTTLNNYVPGGTGTYTQFWPTGPTTTATLQQGGAYLLALSASGAQNSNLQAWIDYDQSGTFEPSEFIPVSTNAVPGATYFSTILVPATADTGYTGMRVRAAVFSSVMGDVDACTEEYYGATQDYVIHVNLGAPCAGVPLAGVASASVASVCPHGLPFFLSDTGYTNQIRMTYQWRMAPAGSAGFADIAGATTPFLTIDSQAVATQYYLKATCTLSGSSDSSNIATVGRNPFYLCYCSPYTNVVLNVTADATPIDSVAIAGTPFNSITPSGIGTYRQYWPSTPSTTASLLQGTAYSIYLNSNGSSNYNAGMWVDANHNGVFEPSEFNPLISGALAGSTISASFIIPPGADTGLTGLRVRAVPLSYTMGGADACSEAFDGATADYIVNISYAFCDTVFAAHLAALTSSTASIVWNSSLSSSGFQFVLDGSGSAPTGSGLAITDTFYHASSLSPGTSYFFHVRNHCITGNFSEWVTLPFSTLCDTVTNILISGITSSSAHVTWSAIGGTTGYQVSLDTSASAPATGSAISDTFVSFSALAPGSTYFFHIRNDCGSSFSPWTTISFSTVCDHVTSLSVFGVTDTSLNINWVGVAGSFDYQYLLDTSAADPSVSAPSTTVTTVHEGGLIPGTTYYAHVRNICGIGSYSVWETIPVSTLCDTVTLCHVTNISSTGATVFWATLPAYSSYEYAIDVSAAPPAAGSASVDTFAIATGLTPGTAYYAHVRNICSGIPSSWVNIPFTTICDSVTGLHVTSVSGVGVAAAWDAISGTLGYEYVVNSTATAPAGSGTSISVDTAAITGLIPGSTYYFHVRSHCSPLGYSTWSTVSFFTPCDTISGLHVVVNSGVAATVVWDSVAGSSTYQYVVDPSAIPPASGTSSIDTAVHVVSLIPGSSYYAHVRNQCGASFSSWVTLHFNTPCDTISGINIVYLSDTSVTARWHQVAGGSTYQYVVDTFSLPPSSGSVIIDTSVHVANLWPGTHYYVHVRNSCGSIYSNWVTTSFTTLCDTTVGLSAVNITDTTAIITWHHIPGSINYQCWVDTFSVSPSTGITVTDTFSIATGLVPGQSYYAHVRHYCGAGYTSWVTVPFSTGYCDTVTSATLVPSDTGVAFSLAPVTGSLGYYYVVNTSSAAPSVGGTFTTNPVDTAIGLTAGTAYFLHVRTACAGGNSIWVSYPFTTLTCDTVTGVVFNIIDTGFAAHWTPSPGAAGYEVLVDMSPLPPSVGLPTINASDTVTTLLPGLTYYFHARVICGGGAYSQWVTIPVTTPDGIPAIKEQEFVLTAFPNPADGSVSLRVKGRTGLEKTITILSLSGTELLNQNFIRNEVAIDISSLASGMYILKYHDEYNTKVIKLDKR